MERVFGRAWECGGAGRKSAPDRWRDYGKGLTHEQRLNQARFMASLIDDRFAIPGTNIPFGLDFLLGRFPGFGDAVTSAISLLIVHHAWASGASKLTLARMLGNGSMPVIGDLFDVAWKANRKNARLLEVHLNTRSGKWEVREPNLRLQARRLQRR